MGYGIIRTVHNETSLLVCGVLDLKKTRDHYVRLKKIFDRTLQLIDEYHPDELAIEAPFYGKNVQSMLKLGRGQGAAISAALHRSVPIFEYAPRKIKLAITGRGSASKDQVARFLIQILRLQELPAELDATDGLAAAVCHQFQNKNLVEGSNYNGWKDFIKKNPERFK